MAKSKRGMIKLKSSESDTFYYSQKNSINTAERIELKKYDPVLRKHVPFKETK